MPRWPRKCSTKLWISHWMLARRDASRRYALWGALVGGSFGLFIAVWAQILPRLANAGSDVYSGAPQGLDQWTYFALVRAIWRSGNAFTYEYPFDLYWKSPPVLLQLPLSVASWIGRFTGLPMAFEILRIAGAAATGAFVALLACRLAPRGLPRRWLLAAMVLAGGWFGFIAIGCAVHVSGLDGLSEWSSYLPRAQRFTYHWKLFFTENVYYPLECIYHALVLAALLALLARRHVAALVLGLLLWASNPFPAVALSICALAWAALQVCRSRGSKLRVALTVLAGWIIISSLGAAYYSVFLDQWPALRELRTRHAVGLAPPPDLAIAVGLWGPWMVPLVWTLATRAGRRCIWLSRKWSLIGCLAFTQTCLVTQGYVVPSLQCQPYHFNRGYLTLACAALFWRMAVACSRPSYCFPRWAIVLLLLTFPDQALFHHEQLSQGVTEGWVTRSFHAAAEAIPQSSSSAPNLVLVGRELPAMYLAACTAHLPYRIRVQESDYIVPFADERNRMLDSALARKNGTTVVGLGIRYAIMAKDDETTALLREQGWRQTFACDDLLLLEPSSSSSHALPQDAGTTTPKILAR